MKIYIALIVLIVMLGSTAILSFRLTNRLRSRTSLSSFSKGKVMQMSSVSTLEKIRQSSSVTHPAYEKVEHSFIEEYGVESTLYIHKKSGAQVLSVAAPDENKVFGITFRTPVDDSTGVPHVLEHSVLCGSRKFPVKEPFVDLLKGSLQNFLNAFTYPDRTCYPVASTNTKDFYNLIHVYLDAVLHPRAISDPMVLQQEGWHFEAEDPASPLTLKGVVYNEMKGVYSSPDSLMGRATQQALFPGNTYAHDSGGQPTAIRNLTYEKFKAFHASYYHPSNSRVYFYGDDDVSKRLELLDEYLREFDKIEVNSKIEFQKKIPTPKKVEIPFPLGEGVEPKHSITVNWLLNEERMSPKEQLAMGILDHLLLGTSSSILKKTLTESQLGESVTGGGLSDELLQAIFSIGMKGVSNENVDKVEKLVLETLKKVAEEGFEADAIESSLNSYEFRLREFNTGSFPRGLSMMLGMLSQWIYDGNPADGVRFEEPLKALKDDLAANKPVFQDLLKKYFVSNDHRVTVEMKPDSELEAKIIEEETKYLSDIKSSMTSTEIEKVIESTKILKEAQQAPDSPEAKATIPRLELSDIDPKNKEIPLDVVRDDALGATFITHNLQTNGILYADIAFDYSNVELDDLELLPLFSRMLMETGTTTYDQTQLSRKIGANTGGISISYYNDLKSGNGFVTDSSEFLLNLLIRGKVVVGSVPVLMELVTDILLNAKLDNQKRAIEMLKESKVRKESSVLSNGHSYGSARIGARSSFLGYLGELTGGITSVRAAGKLLETAEKDWPSIQARLEKLRKQIIAKGKVYVNLTGDEKTLESAVPVARKFVENLPEKSSEAACKSLLEQWKANPKLLPKKNEGFTMPSQVNYVCYGGQIMQPGEKVTGASAVASRFLSIGYLWDQVRVVGGAYGGFARFSDATGRFVYMSYRDPNLAKTLKIYEDAAEVLGEEEISSEDLLQAIVGTVGDLDGPMTPDQKGFSSFTQFLTGESAELRQTWRTEILNASPKDFKDFAASLKKLRETGSVAVFGSKTSMEAANADLPDHLKLEIEQAFGSN